METSLLPAYLILFFFLFRMLLSAGYVAAVAIHESFHAGTAKLFGMSKIVITIGQSPWRWVFNLASIRLRLSLHRSHLGHTEFEGVYRNKMVASCIILLAPLASLAISLSGLACMLYQPLTFWQAIILTPLWLANTHVCFNAFIPSPGWFSGTEAHRPFVSDFQRWLEAMRNINTQHQHEAN